jgi:hypothetical protein
MGFKGTVWQPAKPKVVSKVVANKSRGVIELLQEREPAQTEAERSMALT